MAKELNEYTEQELKDELRRRIEIRKAQRREASMKACRCRYCANMQKVREHKAFITNHWRSGYICSVCSYTTRNGTVKPYIVTESTACNDKTKFKLKTN